MYCCDLSKRATVNGSPAFTASSMLMNHVSRCFYCLAWQPLAGVLIHVEKARTARNPITAAGGSCPLPYSCVHMCSWAQTPSMAYPCACSTTVAARHKHCTHNTNTMSTTDHALVLYCCSYLPCGTHCLETCQQMTAPQPAWQAAYFTQPIPPLL
jgi:hypothetical protein